MQLASKVKFNSLLDELIVIEKECGISTEKTTLLQTAVNNMRLLVPVVGEFSSGKSSLLNNFLEKRILAVGIDPETAIPSELYYSEEEYDEGIDAYGNATKIFDISSAVSNYVCIRRHIKSPLLKEIEPIVLVDMPGFDSPLDAHNKAIFSYLDKGCHYVVLTPVDAGTVSNSMSKQIQNILTFGRDCSFFVSKTDLRSEEEVFQVKEELQRQLSMITGKGETVFELNQKDISLFSNFSKSLNPDELFKKAFKESVNDVCYSAKSSINMQIAALKKDKEKNAHAVEELKLALLKIEDKKKKLIENAKKDTYLKEAESVANAVGSELNSQIDSLVDIAVSSGKEGLQEQINSIVQNTIISNINGVMINITTQFSNELTRSASNLTDIFVDYNMADLMAGIQKSANKLFDLGSAGIDKLLEHERKKTDGEGDGQTGGWSTVAGIFSAVTEIFAPIVEVIIILLPQILNFIFGKTNELKQKNELKEKITGQIPIIKRDVRTKVSQVLQEKSKDMIESISSKYDEELSMKKNEIEQASKNLENTKDINGKIEKYMSCVLKIDTIIEQIL